MCYLLRYPVYSHANGSNERLADAFVNDLLQQRRHGEIYQTHIVLTRSTSYDGKHIFVNPIPQEQKCTQRMRP